MMKRFLILALMIFSVSAFSQKENNKGMASGKNDSQKGGGGGGGMDDLKSGGLGNPSPPPPPGGGGSNKPAPNPNMKQYYIVFLKKGPKRDQDSATAAKIQEGHLKHLKAMGAAGKMSIAGPLTDDGDIRGICIYNVATAEEAKKLAEEDPAVKSGRLIVEVHPFYGERGAKLK